MVPPTPYTEKTGSHKVDRTLALEVTGRWRLRSVLLSGETVKLESDRTLVLRPIAFDRTRLVMLGSLLETTGR